jgi:hypothetical protein
MRSIFNTDIATGKHKTACRSHYGTKGPSSSFGIKNVLPPSRKGDCYVYDAVNTCTPDQLEALLDGSAVVENFIVVEPAS